MVSERGWGKTSKVCHDVCSGSVGEDSEFIENRRTSHRTALWLCYEKVWVVAAIYGLVADHAAESCSPARQTC